jgi:ABC-2 type transport system ATP-binding protein
VTGPATWGASALRLTYDGVTALDCVSVAVTAGQVTAVVGGDGAGKTSLLRCLAGALRPDEGEVHSPGKRGIGYLPASSGIYPDLTVAENLAFRAAIYGLGGAAAARRTAELTDRAGLADARNRLAAQLSGGMRQKLGVIAALLHRPELLILDEPTTGVDPVSRSGVWWLIASAAADGAAVILATTYLDDAQRAASVLVLDAGRQLASGTPEQIVSAMPGSVHAATSRPDGLAGQRAWRRGAGWRVWYPPGDDVREGAGPGVEPDLQDAVTVAALAREPHELAAAAAPELGRRPAVLQTAVPQTAVLQTAVPLAESIGVTCRFGGFTAVSDVSIQVRPGEIVGLLGANGAGKTTLIRMLLGLLSPTAGQVLLLGQPPSRAIRRRIGYVPQGLGLYEDLTPAENMQFAAAVFGVRAGSRAGQVSSLAVGADRSRIPVGRLPLGIQRRTAFAQALAHQPDVLILDEPTSGVDPLGRARLWQAIAGAVQAGAGALVSTHYMEEAGECDRLIIMADGVVVAAGTAAEIIGDAQVTVVEAADWAATFARLERAGLPVSLAGRALRVPGAGLAEVRRVLPDGCRVYTAPATLEERFFDLVLASGRAKVPA